MFCCTYLFYLTFLGTQIRIANELRAKTVEKLWEITEELNILYRDNWTALVDREMVKFQQELFLSGKTRPTTLPVEKFFTRYELEIGFHP